jgi:uncharacterized membrane protein (UPF0127 family)
MPAVNPRLLPVVAALVLVLGGLVGCSDDGGGRGDASTAPDGDLAALSGDAAAARGAHLDQPPGSADRVPLDEFDVGDLSFGEVAVAITDPDGDVTGWCVLVAATPEQRQRGLMEVTDLGGYPGMLFVWDADSSSSFYMRNTPTPLSIAWFTAGGELVSTADMEPCGDRTDCPTYSPGGRHRFALEVPQGQLAGMGVADGSSLAVGGECAPRAPRTG